MNITVRDADSSSPKDKFFPGMASVVHAHAQKVYGRPRSNIQHLNSEEAAKQLSRIGLNAETMVLAWATNRSDLQIPKTFMRRAGYNLDDWPPLENCFPLINYYRHNLGRVDGKVFSMKLEVSFRLMFPTDALQYHKREALADCQQARLVWRRFEEYCKPVEQRGSTAKQKDITDYMTNLTTGGRTFCLPSAALLIR